MGPTIPERIKGYILPCVLIIVSGACKFPSNWSNRPDLPDLKPHQISSPFQ
jgi:hypothetical protein